uniref:Alkyl transferase n=1 Tax=Rhizophora mucronata TaxID=61149 RepID=A0A2P2ISV6_RHIMU
MEKHSSNFVRVLFVSFVDFMRRCMFRVLSMGPIPDHFAFIMDGNRRYAKKVNMEEGAGHRAGFSALLSILKYCYELGVKYVTVYAFSIDNFKRQPDEVQDLMDLMLEKIEELLKEESIVKQYGIRVYFIGNLKLLTQPVRVAAEKVMRVTANNSKCALLVCIAYTSRDEIVHAVEESCIEKLGRAKSCDFNEGGTKNGVIKHPVLQSHEDYCDAGQLSNATTTGNDTTPADEKGKMLGYGSTIKLLDIEKHMYMAVAPEPNILIRSSGETRLSNFLLWQTSNCSLYSPDALWPEIGLWHLVWAVLNFQRCHSYLEKKKKQC